MKNQYLTLSAPCFFAVMSLLWLSTSAADESPFQFRFDAKKHTGREESVVAAKWNGLSPLTIDTGFTETYQNLSMDLSKPSDVRTHWGGGVDVSLLDGKLLAVGEISGGSRFIGSTYDAKKMDAHFHKLALRSGSGNWAYGIDYQSVGKDYTGIYKVVAGQKKDSSAYHIWLDWHLSDFNFRARFSDSMNRASQSVASVSQLVEIESSYKLPFLASTQAVIAYSFGHKWRSQKQSNRLNKQQELKRVRARVKHTGTSFSYTFGSNFSWDKPVASNYGWNQVKEYFVNMRYSFSPTLSLSPSYNIRTQQSFSGFVLSTKNSTATAFSLLYRPLKRPYKLMATVNRKTEVVSAAHRAEKSTLQARLKLDWSVKHHSDHESKFSLSFEQKHRADHISGATNTEKLRVMLLWKLLSA